MKLIYTFYLSFLIALIHSFPLFSQAYQFRNFGVDNGISQPYIYTVNQDKNGYLWVGTGEGLCKFDGIRFKSFYVKDGIAENFVTASFKDKARNLWFGHNQGSITFYNGYTFKTLNTSWFSKSPITCIVGDNKGNVWCATQNDGIFRIKKDFEVDVFKMEFNQEHISSLQFTKNNQLLVGTDEGLMLYGLKGPNEKPVFISAFKGIPGTRILSIHKKNNSGSFWIAVENEGLFLLTPGNDLTENSKAEPIGKNSGIDFSTITDVYEDSQSNLWITTFGNGVVKLLLSTNPMLYNDFQHFTVDNGLGNKFTKTIYADNEGNIWVGTYGTGLIQLTDNCFTFYSPSSSQFSNNVTSILITKKIKWLGTESGLIKMDLSSKQKTVFYSQKNGFVNDKITALFQSDTNHLIVGTDKNGAFQLNLTTNKFSKINLNLDLLSNSINSITGYNHTLFFATKNGIFKIETEKKINTHFTTENGLTHNNISQIFLDSDSTVWIATHSNFLTHITKDETFENFKIYDGADMVNVTGIIKDSKENFWVATFGNGVFKINGKSIIKFTTENGLKSNYCYGIIGDGSSNIWIGHRAGLSCIKSEKNIITQFGKEDGLSGDCNYNSFYKDNQGNAWFGTTTGAVKFDPHKNKKNLVPPIVNITALKLNDKTVEFSDKINLPYDKYKLRIDFIGISFKSNSQIIYQYKMEGYDGEWSDKTNNNFAQYGNLGDGEYTFLIRAYNSDGISNYSPITMNISIAKPIWKKWWFIVLCVIALFYTFYLVIKIRERNHRLFQAKLQKALNAKTREVMIQKEEIEKKNKDITDSIRYAKRIQDAILPDWQKLQKIFPESFVFFQPRDIVSGDFYWFQKYGDKLIVACADATGHGVPGAFMSMIGNTMLKDITARPDVTSPAHALALLDTEIKTLLQQNDDELDRTYDSVDVVFCEINIESYFIRICSTKRPVLLSINGELKMIKKESSDHQNYETCDIQLKKDDIIYMFTDGFTDQFGGEKGKKIKIVNIKLLLDEIQILPMAKQAMIIDRYFNRWKEGNDQTDDVLFLGIKL